MGIQGLWTLLEPVAEPVALETLEGKRLAVDISLWIHQAIHGYNQHIIDSKNPHLSLLINRLAKLLYYKIKPVFVFDGTNVPQFKKALLRERKVKSYIEDMSLSKAQKRLVANAIQEKGFDADYIMQILKETVKRKRKMSDDLSPVHSHLMDSCNEEILNVPGTSTTTNLRKEEGLSSYDQKLDNLLNAKCEVSRGLAYNQIPEDSEKFSNFQIARLRKRNSINEKMNRLKHEVLGKELANGNESSIGKLKLASMEGTIRGHFITDLEDDNIEIIEEPSYQSVSNECSSFDLPSEHSSSSSDMPLSHELITKNAFDGSEEDIDLQEAIRLSLHEMDKKSRGSPHFSKVKPAEKEFRFLSKSFNEISELRKDTWSKSSYSSSDDEFIDVPNEFVGISDEFTCDQNEFMVTSGKTERKKEEVVNEEIDEPPSNPEEVLENETWIPSYVSACSKPHVPDEFTNNSLTDLQRGVDVECQELLRICGIPFVVAPGEAEAQCCEMEKRGFVQGIISDDSDVWLFGANMVYKNMFNQKRQLQVFTSKSIHDQLGLGRWEMIIIGLLSGGDYTNGFKGVGVVTALEILAEFSEKIDNSGDEKSEDKAFGVLQRLSNWLNDRASSMFVSNVKNPSNKKSSYENVNRCSERENNHRTRKLRKLIEENNDEDRIKNFPSREIFNAYVKPVVDNSISKFNWKPVEMEEFRKFVWTKVGWDSNKIKERTEKSLMRWNEFLNPRVGGGGRSHQMHITTFTRKLQKCEQDQRMFLTSRVKTALMRLALVKGVSPSNAPFLRCTNVKIDNEHVSGKKNVALDLERSDNNHKTIEKAKVEKEKMIRSTRKRSSKIIIEKKSNTKRLKKTDSH